MSVLKTYKILCRVYNENRSAFFEYMLCYKRTYGNTYAKDVWPLIWKGVCTPVFMKALALCEERIVAAIECWGRVDDDEGIEL